MRTVILGWVGLVAGVMGCACCERKLGPMPGEDQYERAGRPREVAPWAQPSDNGQYQLYQVGGGAARGGEAPAADEGTWGWDYKGCVPAKVDLLWYHGKYQGGTGAYDTDGPAPCKKLKERHEGQE